MLLTIIGSVAEAPLLSTKLFKAHQWAVLLPWVTYSFIMMNVGTVGFIFEIHSHTHLPHCCEYSPAHELCINAPLKIVPNRFTINYCLSKVSVSCAACLWIHSTSCCLCLWNFSHYFFCIVSWCDVFVVCILSAYYLLTSRSPGQDKLVHGNWWSSFYVHDSIKASGVYQTGSLTSWNTPRSNRADFTGETLVVLSCFQDLMDPVLFFLVFVQEARGPQINLHCSRRFSRVSRIVNFRNK